MDIRREQPKKVIKAFIEWSNADELETFNVDYADLYTVTEFDEMSRVSKDVDVMGTDNKTKTYSYDSSSRLCKVSISYFNGKEEVNYERRFEYGTDTIRETLVKLNTLKIDDLNNNLYSIRKQAGITHDEIVEIIEAKGDAGDMIYERCHNLTKGTKTETIIEYHAPTLISKRDELENGTLAKRSEFEYSDGLMTVQREFKRIGQTTYLAFETRHFYDASREVSRVEKLARYNGHFELYEVRDFVSIQQDERIELLQQAVGYETEDGETILGEHGMAPGDFPQTLTLEPAVKITTRYDKHGLIKSQTTTDAATGRFIDLEFYYSELDDTGRLAQRTKFKFGQSDVSPVLDCVENYSY